MMFNPQASRATSPPRTPATTTARESSNTKERKRSRLGCIVCKVRKVKCDEGPGSCNNCRKLDIQCPGYSPTISSEAPEETVSAIFERAGRKRRRMVGSCTDCRAAKSKCSSDRPTCERCAKRGMPCVYDESLRGPSRSQSPNSRRGKNPVSAGGSSELGESLPRYGSWANTVLERGPSMSGSEDWRGVGGAGDANAMDWLFSPNLPKSSTRFHILIEAYFSEIHSCRSLSFLHKPSFMRAITEGTAEKIYGAPLILVMCALAANIVYWNELYEGSATAADARTAGDRSSGPIPGDQWAKKAQLAVASDLTEITVERLMALVLLCEHHLRTQQHRECFMLSAYVVRVAQILTLDMEQEDVSKAQDSEAITSCEARRRLMWSCYILDLILCSGVKRLKLWDSSHIKIQLPCQERNHNLQISCQTEPLSPLRDGTRIVRTPDNLGLEAYYIRVFHTRGKVLEQIRDPHPRSPPWCADSPFQLLVNELNHWAETLPDNLVFNPTNIYIRREFQQLGAFFGLHLIYHQVFCDLYRVALPGYPFPAASTFDGAPEGFVAQCQNICNKHAARISEILEVSFTHGWKALIEPMCAVIAFESSKHQVVYFTTCNAPMAERRRLWDSLAFNLAVNIKALNRMKGYSRSAEDCISSIQGLLERLNMSAILGALPGSSSQQSSRHTEIVMSDIHNLHQFATYRLVREGLSKPSLASSQSPVTPSRPGEHALSNVRSMDSPQSLVSTPSHHHILPPPQHAQSAMGQQDQGLSLDSLGQPPDYLDLDYESLWAEIDFRRVASENSQLFAWDPMFMTAGIVGNGNGGSGNGGGGGGGGDYLARPNNLGYL